MSAYNIQLPGVVIAGLYKKAVVQGEGKAVEAAGVVLQPRQEPTQRPPVEEVPEVAAAVPRQVVPAEPVAQTNPSIAPAAPQKPAGDSAYKFLGNNRQHIAIIVRFPGEAFLPENHLQLLTKMLGACKLNLGDVAIVNDATQPVKLPVLKEQLSPRCVLLFGVAPDEAGLPLAFPTFKDQEYAGTTYLHTPSLEALNRDTEEGKLLKRKLWECLKKIFNV